MELNQGRLIIQAKTLIKQRNFSEAFHLLTLSLISSSNNFYTKIASLVQWSYIAFHHKDYKLWLYISFKSNKLLRNNYDVLSDQKLLKELLLILCRTANALKTNVNRDFNINKNKHFICFYLLNQCVEWLTRKKISLDEKDKAFITEEFTAVKEEIIKSLTATTKKLENANIINLWIEVYNNIVMAWNNYDDKYYYTPSGDEREMEEEFLVSMSWFKTFEWFIQRINKPNRSTANPQDKNDWANVISSFINSNAEMRVMNNFSWWRFKDFVCDCNDDNNNNNNNKEYKNTFMKNNLTVNTDFLAISKENYLKWSSVFTCWFPIPRYNKQYYLNNVKFMFWNRRISKHNPGILRVFNIQITENTSYENLLHVITRSVESEFAVKLPSEEYSFRIYFVDQFSELNRQFITICYKDRLVTEYEISCDEIAFSNCNDCNVPAFAKNNMIIIESFCMNHDQTWFIKSRKNTSITCQWCKSEVNPDTYLQCEQCSNSGTTFQYLYCDSQCKEKDENHTALHNKWQSLLLYKIPLTQITNESWTGYLKAHNTTSSKFGLIGLINLGNTCFMNSAIQCLSNCVDLTKYFLLGYFRSEINPLSTAEVTNAYYELLNLWWTKNIPSVSPKDFRGIFTNYVKQFSDYSEQDAHEALLFWIDRWHEDWNRVIDKPYIDTTKVMNYTNGNEPIEEKNLSDETWRKYRWRENSIIVDWFHGQFKNRLTCLECGNSSINFDPFMSWSLPIPSKKCKINFLFFARDKGNQLYEISLTPSINATHFRRTVIKDHTKIKFSSIEIVILSKETRDIVAILNRTDNSCWYPYLKANAHEIVWYETDEKKPSIYWYPMKFINEYKYNIVPVINPEYLFYPVWLQVHHNETIEVLYSIINQTLKINKKDWTLKLFLYSNNPCDVICDYCCMYSCKFCSFSNRFHRNETLSYVLSRKTEKKSHIILLLDAERFTFPKNEILTPWIKGSNSIRRASSTSSVSIYDCLDEFNNEEQWKPENKWYCNKCNKQQQACKRLSISKPPVYLIIHLKRFKIFRQDEEISSCIKNNTNVTFNISNFNIGGYIEYLDGECVYDWCGICEHFGTIATGHYIVKCKNVDGKWYEYNDERVTEIENLREWDTENAYMWIYKKRGSR